MQYKLKSKTEKPSFQFFVKSNSSRNFGYYLYNDLEGAMRQAKILSTTGFPISTIYEVCKNKYDEYILKHIFTFYQEKCNEINPPDEMLHVKFYVEAGDWMNPERQ